MTTRLTRFTRFAGFMAIAMVVAPAVSQAAEDGEVAPDTGTAMLSHDPDLGRVLYGLVSAHLVMIATSSPPQRSRRNQIDVLSVSSVVKGLRL